jgi:hypothetical protein
MQDRLMDDDEESSQVLRDAHRVEDAVVIAATPSESPASSQLKPVSKKRSRAVTDDDEIMDLDTIPEEATLEPSAPAQLGRRGRSASRQPTPSAVTTNSRKKRAIEAVHAVELSQISTSRAPSELPADSSEALVPPAHPGKVLQHRNTTSRVVRSISPERDEAFIRAIADLKMRNSKRNEKETDKDFNSMRAADGGVANGEAEVKGGGKVAAADDNEGRDWVLLDDIKLDYGIRGNFMRIVEFEVLGKRGEEESTANQTKGAYSRYGLEDVYSDHLGETVNLNGNSRWAGRPNFKAFRKVSRILTFSYRFTNSRPETPVSILQQRSTSSK